MITPQRAEQLLSLCPGWRTPAIESMKRMLTAEERAELERFITQRFTWPDPLSTPKAWPNALGYYAEGRVDEQGNLRQRHYADQGSMQGVNTAKEGT